MALGIMILLVGGLFSTVRATLLTVSTLQENQHTEQAVHGLFELCRRTFSLLPPAATLTWSNRDSLGSPLPELALRNAPEAFALGNQILFPGEIALATHRENSGGLSLGIEYRRIDRQTLQLLPNPIWLPLVKDIETVRWDFFDNVTGQWQTFWNDPARHPALIRITLAFPGDARKWNQVFWLPPLQSALAQNASATITPAAPVAPSPTP